MRIIAFLLATFLATACASGPTSPTDARLAGTWVQRTAVGGVAFVLNLETRGAVVTGSGTFATAAGGSGTVSAAGTSEDGGLKLSLSYAGEVAQFTGARVSEAELSGSLHLGSVGSLTPSQPVSFDRKD